MAYFPPDQSPDIEDRVRNQNIQQQVLLNLKTQQEKQNLAQGQEQLTEEQRKNSAATMAGEIPAWQQNPKYQTSWANAPAEVHQHFIDAYGASAAGAPMAWNEGVREATGNPVAATGVENLPGNTQYRVDANGGVSVEGNPLRSIMADEATKKEALANQLPTVDEQGRPLSQGELEKSLRDFQTSSGELPMAKQNVLNRSIQRYTASKEYTNAYTSATSMANFLSAFDEAKANPNAANNLALIDNFVRTQNPGVSVRQGTLAMIKNGQALLQKLTPEYLAGHLEEGQFLTQKYAQQARKVLEDEVKAQSEMFDKTVRAAYTGGLKKAGIPTDDFDNPYSSVIDKVSQPQANPYADAKAWLKANPNDPRAERIRDAIARGTAAQ